MTNDTFNSLIKDFLEKIQGTLLKKTKEYNLDEDRLSVFKRAAAIQQQTSAQALLGMLTKHIVSIYDRVETNTPFTEALAVEKIGDAISYLLLLYAVLAEDGFSK